MALSYEIPIVTHSLKYNPALDGLRGIAIALVILFHIWPKYFSFGYVGVDIFFVLSGYLITQIIYVKLQSNIFYFKEFYRNRIRRIFPAMLLVLVTAFIVGYLFLFPSELGQLGKHIKSSAFFYENFRLIGETGYWDEAAQLKPLLHFWSLSIEEHFYIFWPLIIFWLYRLKKNLFFSLIIIFFALIVISVFLDIDSFYNSFSRFWELAFGGLTYASTTKFNMRYIGKLQWIIFALFIVAIGFAYNNNVFSVSKTLFIVVATGLLVFVTSSQPNQRILAALPFVFLGLISFPLYLWHYMIISYMHIFGIDVQDYGFWIILFSVLISYLTYRYVEIYARKQTSYVFASTLFLIAIAVGFLGQYTYRHKGFPARSHLIANEKFEKQFIGVPATNALGISLVTKLLGHKPSNNYIKATSNDPSKKIIAIIGDSHAHTSYPGFAKVFSRYGYETLLVANSSCPPYIGGAMGRTLKDLKQCQKRIQDIYTILKDIPNLKKIIFATRGPEYMYDIGYGVVDDGGKPLHYHFKDFFIDKAFYNQKKKFFEVFENTCKQYSKDKIDFYYLLEDPELGFSPKNCMKRPFDIFPSTCKLKLTNYIMRAGEYRNEIKKIAKQYPTIHILDPKNLYCDNSYCYAVRDGKMLYADDDHHSVDGSLMQAEYFSSLIFKIDQGVRNDNNN